MAGFKSSFVMPYFISLLCHSGSRVFQLWRTSNILSTMTNFMSLLCHNGSRVFLSWQASNLLSSIINFMFLLCQISCLPIMAGFKSCFCHSEFHFSSIIADLGSSRSDRFQIFFLPWIMSIMINTWWYSLSETSRWISSSTMVLVTDGRPS